MWLATRESSSLWTQFALALQVCLFEYHLNLSTTIIILMLRIWALSYIDLWLALNVSYSLVYLFSTFLVVLEQCTFCQGKRYVSLLKVSTLFLKHAIIKGYCEFIIRLPLVEEKQYYSMISNQTRLPAELKHISKRRKRN